MATIIPSNPASMKSAAERRAAMRGGSPFGTVLTVVKFAHQYLVSQRAERNLYTTRAIATPERRVHLFPAYHSPQRPVLTATGT